MNVSFSFERLFVTSAVIMLFMTPWWHQQGFLGTSILSKLVSWGKDADNQRGGGAGRGIWLASYESRRPLRSRSLVLDPNCMASSRDSLK